MNRSLLLDLLRIFAITLVFIAHIGQELGHFSGDFFGIKNFYYVSLGGVGVSLFLILSGLLAGLVESHKKTPYWEYITKKVLRIYLLYWMAVITGFIGYLLREGILNGQSVNGFPSGIGADLVGSVTGFYSWMGLWGGPYNPPSWFIALIMVLYAMFPLLSSAIKTRPYQTLTVLFIVSVGSRMYVSQYALPFGEKHFWDGMVEYAYRQYGFMPGRPADWFPLCRLFEFGLGIFLALKLNRNVWLQLGSGNHRLVAFLSDIAFPLFLVHWPFIFLLEILINQSLPVALSVGLYLGFVFILAHQLSRLDNAIPRQRLLRRFQKQASG